MIKSGGFAHFTSNENPFIKAAHGIASLVDSYDSFCNISNKYRKLKKLQYHIFKKNIKPFYCLQFVWL